PTNGRRGGFFNVQYGTLRFNTGVVNQAQIAFTLGDNRVIGNVNNLPGDNATILPGEISVSGIGTHVLFENDLTNGGLLSLGAQTAPLDVLGNFTNFGKLSLVLQKGQAPQLNILGNVGLAGTLQVGLSGYTPVAGDSFSVLDATGTLTGIFTSQFLPSLSSGLG